jgi:hypothetical protein
MFSFIFLYRGGRSVVVDDDRDIRRHRSAHVVIIQIISLAVLVFLGSQSEELDQTKAQWRRPWCINRARALGCAHKVCVFVGSGNVRASASEKGSTEKIQQIPFGDIIRQRGAIFLTLS